MSGISDAVSKLDMKLGEEYQLITISFNTTDTPEKALTKKENFVQEIKGEDRKHWIYLTGSQENIDAITDALGFRYIPQGLDFAHPSGIMLISPSGKITRYLYGLTFLPFDVKMAIIEAQREMARPTINKVLEMCFSYDPVGRTYTLQVTRIVGAFMIFGAVIVFIVLLVRGRRKTIK
jgi:protein SCO1/2